MVRFRKPLLASLGHWRVTSSVKRRQLGCRVAMLISPENLQGLKGRRSLSMRKATSWYALVRVYRGLDGVKEPIMYHNDRSVNRGEPDVSCNAGTVYNYHMEETEGISGSQTSRIVPKKLVMTVEGRRMHSNVLPEDTFTVLRDGGLSGNEIRKNSR